MNRTRRYFNTNDGGTTRKANSLKELETTEQGLETIVFIAKVTIGFREKETPPDKGGADKEKCVLSEREVQKIAVGGPLKKFDFLGE